MIAKITNLREGKHVRQNQRENGGLYYGYKGQSISYSPEAGNHIDTFIDVRMYYPGEVNCYCCVWVSGKPGLDYRTYGSGGGRAGGYGYDKKSAAFAYALDDAGIELFQDDGVTYAYIGGTGETGITEAIRAIGKAFGYDYIHITKFHA